MRKVIVSEFLTLDGVMQAPGLPDEDRSGGFEHGGWQVALMDEEAGSVITEGLAATGGLLLGLAQLTKYTLLLLYGLWPLLALVYWCGRSRASAQRCFCSTMSRRTPRRGASTRSALSTNSRRSTALPTSCGRVRGSVARQTEHRT